MTSAITTSVKLNSVKAMVAEMEVADRLLTDGEVAQGIALVELQKQLEAELETESRLQAEAEAAEEAAYVAAVVQAEQDLVARREFAAKTLAQKGEGKVAAALRGFGPPAWGRDVLVDFQEGFARHGRRGTFHNTVEEVIALAEAVIAAEAQEDAEAERIRQEAKKRQAQNRLDRAALQSRGAKGGTGGGKKKS